MYDNRILHAHGKAKTEDLERIEQKFQVKIPAAVRERYLTYNGGDSENPVFTDKNGNAYIFGWFIPVCGGTKRSVEKTFQKNRLHQEENYGQAV